jgi:hypothetical protein
VRPKNPIVQNYYHCTKCGGEHFGKPYRINGRLYCQSCKNFAKSPNRDIEFVNGVDEPEQEEEW